MNPGPLQIGDWPMLIVLAIGAAGTVVGILLLRRLLTIEPDSRSFASTRRGGRIWPYALIVAGLSLLALLAVLLLTR